MPNTPKELKPCANSASSINPCPPCAGIILPATLEVAFLRPEILKCERSASMRHACAFPRRALAGPSTLTSTHIAASSAASYRLFSQAKQSVPRIPSVIGAPIWLASIVIPAVLVVVIPAAAIIVVATNVLMSSISIWRNHASTK